jgi:hypothetical protein
MTDRLLNLLDPEDLNRSLRTVGWIAGELVGIVVAGAVLLFVLAYLHVG